MISPLRRKVIRDLRRLWAQAVAIALVLAAGVATQILGSGAFESLYQTRTQYYETNRFADVFADVTRAPMSLIADVRALDGVLAAEGRIVKLGLLDMPDMAVPGTVLLVSAPADRPDALNGLHLRLGRMPDPLAAQEVVISEEFARAHRLRPGADFSVLMNGHRRTLQVTGIALSPEFIYALGPGEMMPDPRRFGIVWMPRPSLETAFDLSGAFSNIVLKLAPGVAAGPVIANLDRLTARYGGQGAITRDDQMSHAFLDAELKQLQAMVRVLPPIFLAIAAMLVNMTISRLIVLEREQIGLLKAIGYSSGAIARHYIEFVSLIALAGIALGFFFGAWLGAGLAQLYARFFSFPFLIFTRDPQIYGFAAVVALVAAIAGAWSAVHSVGSLPPAVAMAPPAPMAYRQGSPLLQRLLSLPQTGIMVLRHLIRWPLRTLSSMLGVAMSVAILVASLWSEGSIDLMIDITFHQTERQDIVVAFAGAKPARAELDVARMPGVLATEAFRAVPSRISHQNRSRRISLIGKQEVPEISRLLDPKLRPMTVPPDGLVLSEALANALDVGVGESVQVEIQEGRRTTVSLPVSGLSLGYVGLGAVMHIDALNRLMGEGPAISGINLLVDKAQQDAFFAAAKATPTTGFVTVTALTLNRFRQTLAENITIMNTVYLALAGIIAFGVIYNFARISLSEQGRELASLRVLGFTRGEVSAVLFGELTLIVLLAQPVGWIVGYGLGWAMVAAFSSDLYRVPFVIGREVFATASLVVLAASLVSALMIRGRINRLDMIEVLKTRE